jgi:Uma2 family endonuclease
MDATDISTAEPNELFYPERDGEPRAETGTHVMAMVILIATLRAYFRHHPDIYVIGNIFLYYREGDPTARKSPDLMVIRGVKPGERRSFKTWEERAVPCFILEVTSQGTANEDLEAKRLLYQELGVREYFLFDPLHEYLEQPLMGYLLIGEEYEPLVPAKDGGLLSQELGLRLVPEGDGLALFRFKDGQRVLAPPEMMQLLEDTQKQAREDRHTAQQAEKRAEQAERHAIDTAARAEKRIKDLEAELERLRAQQAPPPPSQG